MGKVQNDLKEGTSLIKLYFKIYHKFISGKMENFDRENIANCWEFVKFVNVSSHQNFVPYSM